MLFLSKRVAEYAAEFLNFYRRIYKTFTAEFHKFCHEIHWGVIYNIKNHKSIKKQTYNGWGSMGSGQNVLINKLANLGNSKNITEGNHKHINKLTRGTITVLTNW